MIRLSLFLPLLLAALPLTSCSTALMAHRILNSPPPPPLTSHPLFIDPLPFFHFTFCFNHLLCRFKHLSASPLPTLCSPATLHQTVHLLSSLSPFFLFFSPIQPSSLVHNAPPPLPPPSPRLDSLSPVLAPNSSRSTCFHVCEKRLLFRRKITGRAVDCLKWQETESGAAGK